MQLKHAGNQSLGFLRRGHELSQDRDIGVEPRPQAGHKIGANSARRLACRGVTVSEILAQHPGFPSQPDKRAQLGPQLTFEIQEWSTELLGTAIWLAAPSRTHWVLGSLFEPTRGTKRR